MSSDRPLPPRSSFDQAATGPEAGLASERAKRLSLQRALGRTRRFERVTNELFAAQTVDRIADVLARGGALAMGARFGFVVLAEENANELSVISAVGLSAEKLRTWQRFPTSSPFPCAEAVVTGRSVWVGSLESVHARFPSVANHPMLPRTQAWAAVPLRVGERVHGALGFGFATPQSFPLEQQVAIENLASRGALAIARARVYREAQTARDAAERERDFLRGVLANAPVGIGILQGPENRLSMLNSAVSSLKDLPKETSLSRPLAEARPEINRAARAMIDRVRQTGRSETMRDLLIELPNHQTVVLDLTFTLQNRDSKVTRDVMLFAVDVTGRNGVDAERSRLLRQLTAERDWLQTVIERSPVGIIRVEDSDGSRLILNGRAKEIMGCSFPPDADLSAYAAQILRLDGTPYPVEDLAATRALRGETVRKEEKLIRQPDGRDVHVLVNAEPIHQNDSIVGAVVTTVDITQIRDLERLREEWTSIVAHELRQPVTMIMGYAGLIDRQLQENLPPELSRALHHIRLASHRLNSMVRDLLDVSRIEAKHLTLGSRSLDLSSLVQGVVERMSEVMGDHRVRIETDGTPAPVRGDPSRIEQILTNLLTNAAKYGNPRTDVVVRLAHESGFATIAVTNQGPGITSSELPHLFDRFYRANEARFRQVGGLGLGLYITKGIVEAHGGQISVESVLDQSTTFRFTLPLASASD
ncbi:MAG TPA: ATP-binding protein [Chloroflexota bacterium]|nr:ATP-binding protein [Chloroflexota bacterium]